MVATGKETILFLSQQRIHFLFFYVFFAKSIDIHITTLRKRYSKTDVLTFKEITRQLKSLVRFRKEESTKEFYF